MGNSTLSITGPQKDLDMIIRWLLWKAQRRHERGYPEVSWVMEDVMPSAENYINRDTALVFNYLCNTTAAAITVTWKMLLPNGKLVINQQNFITAANSTFTSLTWDLDEGFLVSLTVALQTGSSRVPRGDTWVVVGLAYSKATPLQPFRLLIRDYFTSTAPLAWPDGQLQANVDGQGLIQGTTFSTPAAGADFSQIVAATLRVKLHTVTATLTTNATAGNRTVLFVLQNPVGTTVWTLGPLTVQTASKVVIYNLIPGTALGTDAAGNQTVPLPTECVLDGGFLIASVTTGLLGTDAWTNIKTLWEVWWEI